MEYRKDKRTKNLTLRDIHVGDWVQIWSEQTERYSPPLKIIQICDDGTIYLVGSDEERCDPWEEDIKNVDALPIDADLLRGFGFDVIRQKPDEPLIEPYLVRIDNMSIGKLYFTTLLDLNSWDLLAGEDPCSLEKFRYMHELVGYLLYYFDIKLEWKGVHK